MALNRVGILTGGGDCSGLNAVVRAITRTAIIQHKATVVGIEDGFDGLIFDRHQELSTSNTKNILSLGGTIIGTTNKGNPFKYRERDANGKIQVRDYSNKAVENLKKLNLDCLFIVGGDGTLQIANRFHGMGLPVIGIPKTIDNDLKETDYSFGFHTAVQVASDAIDRLQTTGRSHDRVMILEVMGRDSGWIALESGIAGGAHIILIPEIPYLLDKVMEKIRKREAGGSPYTIIVVAEAACEAGGKEITAENASERLQGVKRYGGVGAYLTEKIGSGVHQEVRCTVLGHTQRGGTPVAFDRILGTRLGVFAVKTAVEGKFGNMVALKTPNLILTPLANLAGSARKISPTDQLIESAEAIGINLGR